MRARPEVSPLVCVEFQLGLVRIRVPRFIFIKVCLEQQRGITVALVGIILFLAVERILVM